MRSVLSECAHATKLSTSVTVLAYAAVGLPYPGEAPQSPVDLARCMDLLRDHDWMRERAFEYLDTSAHGAWPYLIGAWDELEMLVECEIGREAHADAYAPQVFAKMRQILARRCNKPHCNHEIGLHAHAMGQPRQCSVPGCRCGFFLPAL